MPFRRSYTRGGALAPIIIIVVALALSTAVFFLYTKKRMDEKKDAETAVAAVANEDGTTVSPPQPAQAATAPKPEPAAAAASASPESPAPAMAPAPPPPPKPSFGFARPGDVAAQLARSMAAGEMADAAKLISAGDPAQETAALAALEKLKALGLKSADPGQVQVIGQVESAMRLAIPLMKADGTPSDARIQIDVEKDPKMGWKISTLHLPKELGAAVAATPMPAPTVNPEGGAPLPTAPTMTKPLIVVESGGPDAITFASDFVRSLLKLDYEAARKYVDEEKIPSVKLAGLCIVFEDGRYSLQESKPLMATIATEKTSWIIAKVKSSLHDEETEFGLEMEKRNGGWLIVGLNLSKLLADNAKSSAAVGIPYTPLVQNPKGGESIALYYEYDSAMLHPRAKAQLKIVASVLKASPAKKLRITGHTDAMGSDTYNIALSQKRAESVKQFFVEEGVPLTQVEATGFGKTIPLSPNLKPDGTDNPEGRGHNRRAEILLDF